MGVFDLQGEAGVLGGHLVGVEQFSYELLKILEAADVETQGHSAGELAEADALRVLWEEGAEGLLLLDVVRVEYDGQFLEGSNDEEGICILAAGHAHKPFIFDHLDEMVEVVLADCPLLTDPGVDGDEFREVLA
jgi:hypothetical protein